MPRAKTRRALTPVNVTSRYPSFRAGRVETWSAVSRDGAWKYERLEMAGTPWSVIHVPTGHRSRLVRHTHGGSRNDRKRHRAGLR